MHHVLSPTKTEGTSEAILHGGKGILRRVQIRQGYEKCGYRPPQSKVQRRWRRAKAVNQAWYEWFPIRKYRLDPAENGLTGLEVCDAAGVDPLRVEQWKKNATVDVLLFGVC